MAETGVQVVQVQDQELMARWLRAEQAFDMVRLQGRSLRFAAEALGVSHDTVWRDVRAYEAYLAATRTSHVDERRAAFEAMCYRVIERAVSVFEAAGDKSLNKTAALNTINTTLGHLRAVQGLDAPKADAAKEAGTSGAVIRWAGDDEGGS